ncbi:substrate-binding domain-containing protein [Rhizobium leguminosarum]|uniref:substrate-binding domain-containing protein n=1 Tax=Rhizobium leguminosarum TaxID=384 RepID=UPI00098F9C4B|nr:substrate-binding domain-containing protein [Rhizobium leguminosarum]ASS59034.1 rhizopine-binding protein [Rhizobium leguminosarum bv. viciae]MBB4332080.1 ribose transport system substrate-binding protein/inositol transport system substrate-binding protein [Rhizobium leguminosarum]MBB4357705.1 ribose transport system substrate-binding protein/inositol transport system substrate-binding protein [Rhizobium leguminosarum]MBB4386250.1 ribose transport system substrate-binding protein/inositol tr
MKKLITGTAALLLATSPGYAGDIGVAISHSDSFLAVMVQGMKDEAAKTKQPLQIEFAEADINKQLSQIQNFIAAKVDAIIVNVVESSASPAITKMAADAGVPLIYVNNTPSDLDALGSKAAFIGSNEAEAGELETKEVCRVLKESGKTSDAGILIIQGILAQHSAELRSKAVHDVIATPDCNFMKVIDEQSANWDPVKAQDLMTNWITAGYKPAAVIANNDEMALGAINSMKAAGWDMKDVVVAGIDATKEAMHYMQTGDLDVSVFQDAIGQGAGSVDAAIKMAKGEKVQSPVWIPFELVNPANVDKYISKN